MAHAFLNKVILQGKIKKSQFVLQETVSMSAIASLWKVLSFDSLSLFLINFARQGGRETEIELEHEEVIAISAPSKCFSASQLYTASQNSA